MRALSHVSESMVIGYILCPIMLPKETLPLHISGAIPSFNISPSECTSGLFYNHNFFLKKIIRKGNYIE